MTLQNLLKTGRALILTKRAVKKKIGETIGKASARQELPEYFLVENEDGQRLQCRPLPLRGASCQEFVIEVLTSANGLKEIVERWFPHRAHKASIDLGWDEVEFPLCLEARTCHAFGMTFKGHQRETGLAHPLHFQKEVRDPVPFGGEIFNRPNLDYETEVGLLIGKPASRRAGYFIAVDFSDRGLQVMTYNRKNPGPGFKKSKSFAQALGVGPWLLLGDFDCWEQLQVELYWNERPVQNLNAKECIYSVSDFVSQIREMENGGKQDFEIILSGTPEGVIFQKPGILQTLKLLGKNLSVQKAKRDWLKSFRFLEGGDRLRFGSNLLGRGEIRVISL